MDLRPVQAALKRLEKSVGRIARRNARRALLSAPNTVRRQMDREYPSIAKSPVLREPTSIEHPALRDAVRLSWRRWEWKHLNPGATPWDRSEAQVFVDFYAASIGKAAKPIVFDLPDGGRLLGQHASDRIRLHPHRYTTRNIGQYDTRTKRGYRSSDWCKWRTLLHEVAHYRAHGHGAGFKRELWIVFQAWKQWRAERHHLAAAAKNT
jgi:hypothetical protein